MKKYLMMAGMFFSAAIAQTPPDLQTEEPVAQKYEITKVPNTAFTYGEKLNYRVYYGLINGGYANFEVAGKPQQVNNRNVYYIKVHGKSTGLVDMMFKVRDEYESYLDEDALVPWKSTKNIKEGNYRDNDFIVFDHENRTANSRRGKIEIAERTQDIISSIYYARSTDMTSAKPGDMFPVNFYLDGKNYQLRFKFVGRETLKTDLGTFRTLKVKPQLLEGRVFKDSEALTLWVTDDMNKVPLRVESDIFVGSIKADLEKFENLRNPLTSKIK